MGVLSTAGDDDMATGDIQCEREIYFPRDSMSKWQYKQLKTNTIAFNVQKPQK